MAVTPPGSPKQTSVTDTNVTDNQIEQLSGPVKPLPDVIPQLPLREYISGSQRPRWECIGISLINTRFSLGKHTFPGRSLGMNPIQPGYLIDK